jgi:hypothetical protein
LKEKDDEKEELMRRLKEMEQNLLKKDELGKSPEAAEQA